MSAEGEGAKAGPDTILIDLDGTLSDGRDRYYLVKGKHRDHEAFHARLDQDPVNEWCRALMGSFGEQSYRVVIVSARPKYCEEATRAWLFRNRVYFDELNLLRPDGDSTPDQELKRAWLRGYGKERILFTVDDRQKVVDMWREEGLTCLQCANWGERTPDPATVRVLEAAKKVKVMGQVWTGVGDLMRAVEALAGRWK